MCPYEVPPRKKVLPNYNNPSPSQAAIYHAMPRTRLPFGWVGCSQLRAPTFAKIRKEKETVEKLKSRISCGISKKS